MNGLLCYASGADLCAVTTSQILLLLLLLLIIIMNPRSTILTQAVSWHRLLVTGLSLRRPEFAPGSVHVRFVVGKVALGQVSVRVHRVSPVSVITLWLFILIYHLGDEQYAVGGRSSETVSPHRHE
jgi:small-conductance mechanosensitive channel